MKEIKVLGAKGELEAAKQLIESAQQKPQLLLFRRIIELLCTQRSLIWMVHNVTGSEEERAHRRRGWGSEEHRRMSKKVTEWDKKKFSTLLKRFSHA